MVDKAITLFKEIEERIDGYTAYRLIEAFYYLSLFKSPITNAILEKYINHKDYLLSYNAKKHLEV